MERQHKEGGAKFAGGNMGIGMIIQYTTKIRNGAVLRSVKSRNGTVLQEAYFYEAYFKL